MMKNVWARVQRGQLMMRWAQLALVAIGLMMSDAVQAEDASFRQANEHYVNGEIDRAIAGYEKLIADHGFSGPVLHNLGNAYFKEQKVGPAVLAYERALLLDPGDERARASLRFVREESGLTVPREGWVAGLRALSPSGWAWLTTVLLYVFCGLVLARWFLPRLLDSFGPFWSMITWRTTLVTVAAGLFLSAVFWGLSAQERPRAVVMTSGAAVRAAPFPGAEKIGDLAEGHVIMPDKQQAGFAGFRFDKKTVGWIALDEIEPVDPELFAK